MKTIFSVNDFHGELSEASFSGCGEISPIKKDPNFHTFGIGTKILLNDSIGYILGKGTLSSKNRRNFSGLADMHHMDPDYLGGFKTSASPEVISTWAVPIPIVNDEVLKTASATDEELELPIVDVLGRDHLGKAKFSDVWLKDGIFVKYNKNKCKELRGSCKDANGKFTCPPENLCPMDAFSIDNEIDYTKCFYCGTCVAYCLQGLEVCSSQMGNVSLGDKQIPIVLRHSDRVRAEKLAKRLKNKLLSGEFELSEPIDDINYD
jgi:putative methanogenesis marker 16 metalloprotein